MGGDESAFEALYVNHRQAIWAYFFASCHDRDLAMDGVQDVFLQAWRCIDRLCVLSPVQQKAWIYQTARRRLIDIHRHQIVVDRENSKIDRDFHNPIPADPGDLIENREQLQAISHIVQSLPPKQREIFILATVGEMARTEIAQLLALRPATVRSRLAAARRQVVLALRADDLPPRFNTTTTRRVTFDDDQEQPQRH